MFRKKPSEENDYDGFFGRLKPMDDDVMGDFGDK